MKQHVNFKVLDSNDAFLRYLDGISPTKTKESWLV